jgi:hypothetical protein
MTREEWGVPGDYVGTLSLAICRLGGGGAVFGWCATSTYSHSHQPFPPSPLTRRTAVQSIVTEMPRPLAWLENHYLHRQRRGHVPFPPSSAPPSRLIHALPTHMLSGTVKITPSTQHSHLNSELTHSTLVTGVVC